jgi:hypothetical protein
MRMRRYWAPNIFFRFSNPASYTARTAAVASFSGAPEGVKSLDHSTLQPRPDSRTRMVAV